jgi:thiosulfate reductase cytochrome b subunit/mono/diheme cytochrome c family protein
VDCHHSLNNPVYHEEADDTRPAHLDFDARRASLADYLETPSHQFARGHASTLEEGAPYDHSMRRCESCHDEQVAHDWLPFAQSHFNALSCEACHIPALYASALQVIDWSLPAAGEPRLELRGVDGDPQALSSLITGYRPVLLPRKDEDGRSRLAPYNLVSTWYWTQGTDSGPEVLSLDRLEAVLAPAGVWSPAVLALLDADGNGSVDGTEQTPRQEEQVRALTELLQSAGIREPALVAQTDAIPVSHGVAGPGHATKECATCHGQDSRLKASLVLATAWPGGVLPRWTAGDEVTPASITTGATGELLFTGSGEGAFVLGHDHRPWVNLIGMGSLVMVLLLILVHGTLRWRSARNVAHTSHAATKRVYMYGRYERFWHWLQALAIAGLIFTGLTVHAPDVFRFGSFQAAVQVHNVLGFVLLANAFFSLFYHVAGGSVRQYLPTPRGFFNQAIRQVLYYTQGIFKGEKHPFEKTPGRKLNPLQKIVYLLILNLLLPFQILGGILIWGAQHWPELAENLGGLAFLVPLHSLGAWLFASFLVMHIYLTTTGHTVTSNLRAMVSGFEEVPRTEPEETQR